MQIRTPGTWWVFRNVGFHPTPLPPIPVFITVETHIIDGTPGTAMRKQGHGEHELCNAETSRQTRASSRELRGPPLRFKEGVRCWLP